MCTGQYGARWGYDMGKKSSNIDDVRPTVAKPSLQLELVFARKSGTVVMFPKARTTAAPASSESALKRLLDFAATLPGK
jgi:hypothetical protein